MSGEEANLQGNDSLPAADQPAIQDDLAFVERYLPPRSKENESLCWKLPGNKQILHDLKILGYDMDKLLKALCQDAQRKELLAQMMGQLCAVEADAIAFNQAMDIGIRVQAMEIEMAIFRKASDPNNGTISKFLLEKLMPERYGKSVKERIGDEQAAELRKLREEMFSKK